MADELIAQLSNFTGEQGHSLLDEDGNVNVSARGRVPSEEELSREYAAPGDSALLPFGITFAGDWKRQADGMSRHSREQVLALAESGLPVRLESMGESARIFDDELHPDVLPVDYLQRVTLGSTVLAIKHLVISSPEHLKNTICPMSGSLPESAVERIFRSTIVYTSWERTTVHEDVVDILNRVGRVWVPCEANRDAFVESGVSAESVKVIPFPFDPNLCKVAAPRGSENLPSGRRYYNIGKWEPRKNQHRLLGAFLIAHTPRDRASLLIKTSKFGDGWAGYPSPEESIRFWLEDEEVRSKGWTQEHLDRLVRVITDKISEEEMQLIHAKNNIYVSAAAGEAWDIPAFEAKCSGNRLVHVGYGGSEDYQESEDVQVDYVFAPVHPGYRWEPEAKWAEYSVEQLSSAMKKAKIPERRVLPPHLVLKFSRHAVGEMMRTDILDLADSFGGQDLRESGAFG